MATHRPLAGMGHMLIAACIFAFVFASCRAPKELVYHNVQHFHVDQAGLQSTKVSLDISLYNPNNYRLRLKNADVDVFVNGNHLGKLNTKENFRVNARDSFLLPATLAVDMKNVLPNALRVLLDNEVTLKVAGNVRAGRHGIFINVPVSYEGKQNLDLGFKW